MIESKIDWDSAPEWADRVGTFDGDKANHLAWANKDKYKFIGHDGTHLFSSMQTLSPRTFAPAQYRPVEDKVEWDGKGKPPIGCKCEMQDGGGLWREVSIFSIHKGFAHGWHQGDSQSYFSSQPHEFRPLKTAEEKEREAFHLVVVDACMGIHKDDFNIDEIAGVLFYAGFKAPKAEK